MYFNHAFRKSFLPATPGNTLSLTNATPQALTAGQIGIYSASWSILSTATESITPFYIVMGSYFNSDKISPALGGYKESVKSKLVNPKYISRVIRINANAPRQMVIQVPVTCGLACDTTYRLRVDVKGSPALRFLSHNMYRTLDAYTGCCNTTDPTLQKDPVPSLLQWADEINQSPIFNTMVQARVYKIATTLPATSAVTATTSQTTIPMTTTTGVLVGQKVVGTGIPANAFVTTVTASTSIVIKYPVQQVAPTIASNVSMKFYSDLYSGDVDTYGYPATAAGGSITTPTYIPGTGTQTGVGGSAVVSPGIATGANISTTTGGALIYTPLADAASFTVDAHIELTGAYIETSFGTCTFTPTDKYDLEPLLMYTSMVDESGDPCAVSCFTTSNSNTGTNTAANLATIVQAPVQALGYGETVLRDLILSGRYLQNAYPDSSRVESLRMREIEADPMLNAVTRTALYDQILILHSVPRFNNPTSTFDNDQYLLVYNVPTGATATALTNFVVRSANLAQGGSVTSGILSLETY
jgi:hypothetical protein